LILATKPDQVTARRGISGAVSPEIICLSNCGGCDAERNWKSRCRLGAASSGDAQHARVVGAVRLRSRSEKNASVADAELTKNFCPRRIALQVRKVCSSRDRLGAAARLRYQFIEALSDGGVGRRPPVTSRRSLPRDVLGSGKWFLETASIPAPQDQVTIPRHDD